MNKTQRLRYARAILLLQDKITLAYQKRIRRELKQAATDLSLSYQTNQSQLGFAAIQDNHKQALVKILNDLALETITRFSKLDVFGKKDIFAVQIANNIYAELAQNVLTTAATVSATTVASATYVILKQMELSKTKPKPSEPENIAKAISKKLNAVSVSRAMTIARTETHRAANTTQFRRAEWAANTANLEVEVEWIATNDSRVRDSHRHVDGQKRPMGQTFNVGGDAMRYPSDPRGSAKNTINCRCVLGYDTIEQ